MTEVTQETLTDLHRRAVEYADNHTRFYYGDDSVPCEPGSDAHTYWLSQYDGFMEHNLGSN